MVSAMSLRPRMRFSARAVSTNGTGRLMGKAVLEVGIHRQVGRLDDLAGIGDHLGAADLAVGAAQQVGDAEAGGCERLVVQPRQDLGRARIPWIGNEEAAGP